MDFLISENAQVIYLTVGSIVGLIAIYKFVKEAINKAFINFLLKIINDQIISNLKDTKLFLKNIGIEKTEMKGEILLLQKELLVLQNRFQNLQEALENENENMRIVSQKIDNIYQILINSKNT